MTIKQKEDWLKERIIYIRGLKSPNEYQAVLLRLFEQQERSDEEEKYLNILIRAEKAADRAAKAKQVAEDMVRADKKAMRKKRAHRLILQGILFDLAGLADRPRNELLGILLAAATVDDTVRRKAWAEKGEARLSQPDAKQEQREIESMGKER